MTPSYQDLYKALKVAEEALVSIQNPEPVFIKTKNSDCTVWISNSYIDKEDMKSKAAAALSHIKPLLKEE